ncbi:hypothetical protein AnigIFM59636_001331 [Aspergillus niger]|nr:hypothetical protein AnigIFM59636_001331 [Aspergillus niger]
MRESYRISPLGHRNDLGNAKTLNLFSAVVRRILGSIFNCIPLEAEAVSKISYIFAVSSSPSALSRPAQHVDIDSWLGGGISFLPGVFRDNAFSEWFDVSAQAPQYLWLQGMPGAGKTYLCAAAVGHARERHRVLFALVNHAAKKTTTALGVLQSMIFQAAEENQDLQAILLEAKERELRGNTLYVTELFKSFLKTASQTYIMIDGLDEMDERERQVLLERLEEIAKECCDLRILISCRPEGDISRRLEKKACAIKIHDRNAGSIQHYIDHRARDWISELGCSPSLETELYGLLSPLAAKAAVGLDDIRRELKALPEDLNDA